MKTSKYLKLALAGVAALAFSSGANAAFSGGGHCSDGSATGGISESDMTLNGYYADDCYGLVSFGGDVENEIANINDLGWGTYSVSNFLKDDSGGSATASFLGMDWDLSANNGSNDSTYTLTVTEIDTSAEPNLPMTTDIVGFLKAGPPGAFFLFEDVEIDTTNAGTFQISWTVGAGNNPGLSGLSLFIGEPGGGGGPGGGPGIPSPGTLLLILGPLAGVFANRRRTRGN